MYAPPEFGTYRMLTKRFVLTNAESDQAEEMSVEKTISFLLCCRGTRRAAKRLFVQIKVSVVRLGAVDGAFRCVGLRRQAARGGENETEMNTLKEEGSRTAAEEWFALASFESIFSTLQGISARTAW